MMKNALITLLFDRKDPVEIRVSQYLIGAAEYDSLARGSDPDRGLDKN